MQDARSPVRRRSLEEVDSPQAALELAQDIKMMHDRGGMTMENIGSEDEAKLLFDKYMSARRVWGGRQSVGQSSAAIDVPVPSEDGDACDPETLDLLQQSQVKCALLQNENESLRHELLLLRQAQSPQPQPPPSPQCSCRQIIDQQATQISSLTEKLKERKRSIKSLRQLLALHLQTQRPILEQNLNELISGSLSPSPSPHRFSPTPPLRASHSPPQYMQSPMK
eukprot:TRINITY_DN37255_c0_g1_i1.p1 TRINITY_DN37255_c0_g1~~TRINITY_DN37255_c0_g1_i1.p1  ORF type:complete len:241 (+),score=50.16 TRINITY_DN37255_c0_g1_i1:53-724(+)